MNEAQVDKLIEHLDRIADSLYTVGERLEEIHDRMCHLSDLEKIAESAQNIACMIDLHGGKRK